MTKTRQKSQIINFVKLTVHTYACNGLTDFDYEALLKVAWFYVKKVPTNLRHICNIFFSVKKFLTHIFRSKISNQNGWDWRNRQHHWNPRFIRVSMAVSVLMHSHARLSILPVKNSNLRAKKNIEGGIKTTFLSLSHFISLIRPIRWNSQINSISVICKKF